jgi:hypothetical protein
MSVNITSLNSTLGAYARQNQNDIFHKILKESTKSLFTQFAGAIDQLPLTRLRTASTLKPYAAGGAFTAAADALVLSARILNVRRCSFDLSIVPLDLYNSWLGQLAGAPPNSPFDIPFEQFLMDAIAKQVIDDLETAVWTGTYNGSGTTPAATMDGLLTLVTAAITALEIPAINVYAGAAITSANALDQVKGIRALIAPQYRTKDLVCLMAVENVDNYLDDYQASVGSVVYNKSYDQIFVEGTRAQVIGVPAMTGSDRVIFTPKENLVFGYDVEAGSNITTQEFNRTIKVMGDFRAGVQFRDGQVIWTNDQS